jgi:hypothetical protein
MSVGLIASIISANAEAGDGCTLSRYDFEDGTVSSVWSGSTLEVDTAPSGQKFLGRADGLNLGLHLDEVLLTLSDLPVNGSALVEFDFYALTSLDGTEPFRLRAGNNPNTGGDTYMLLTSFSLSRYAPAVERMPFPDRIQSYPWPNSPALTGSRAKQTQGYVPPNDSVYGDAIFPVKANASYQGNALYLYFTMFDLQAISDESWGLDNVKVTVCP